MASPFVYVPEASGSTPQYQNPYYTIPQGVASPFLPPSPLLYPSSPYLGPIDGARASSTSPNAFNPNSVLWPDAAPHYESAYTAGWIPLSPRQRTNSWQGPAPQPNSPFIPPTAPGFLHAQSSYFPGHKKSNSWGNTAGLPPWVTHANPYVNNGGALLSPQKPLLIHPFLNGDAPSPHFHFDLAPSAFMPLRLVSTNPPQSAVLGAEIREAAFHPPLMTLRILHPRLPFWPIDFQLPAGAGAAPGHPISLGDVLVVVHQALHQRITQADWATLGEADAQGVARAFTQRCRGEAVRSRVPPVQLRDREVAERNQGVKRVDFLLGKTIFKGLIRAPGDPEGVVRMVTA
ncbi:hypothetical protein B0H11DRAFT_2134345 [Mycena galericulata]|nr:hypothetical protein B0H11DRAFT_2134345 [Mycena galericulata]